MFFHFALPTAVSPKVAQIRTHRCFYPLFDGIFFLAAIANRGLVWAPPPTKRFELSICIPENFLSTISFSGPTTNVPWSRTGGQMPKQKRGARGQPRSCTFFFLLFSGYQQARVARRRAEERRRPSHRSLGGLAACCRRARTHVVLFASCGTKDYFNKIKLGIIFPSFRRSKSLKNSI